MRISTADRESQAVVRFDALDAAPVPRLFFATTVQWYVLPAVSPATVIVVVVPDLLRATPPLVDLHVAV